MPCTLYKYVKVTATHWVGKTGNEYPKDDFINLGTKPMGLKKDLPLDEYPYTVKYKTEQMFRCCDLCNCEGK